MWFLIHRSCSQVADSHPGRIYRCRQLNQRSNATYPRTHPTCWLLLCGSYGWAIFTHLPLSVPRCRLFKLRDWDKQIYLLLTRGTTSESTSTLLHVRQCLVTTPFSVHLEAPNFTHMTQKCCMYNVRVDWDFASTSLSTCVQLSMHCIFFLY